MCLFVYDNVLYSREGAAGGPPPDADTVCVRVTSTVALEPSFLFSVCKVFMNPKSG